MENVLLIGGRSFIGGHVCRALIQRGYHVLLHSTSTPKFENLEDILPHQAVTPVKCAYENKAELSAMMAKVQYVIFLAPPPGKQTVGQGKTKDRDFDNTKNILDLIKAHPIKKSVFISTCSTIGKVAHGVADETCMPKDTQGWEGLAFKFKLESLIMAYCQKGVPIVIVNPTMFIGEYDTKPSSGEFFKFINTAPFVFLKKCKMNIVDLEDAGRGVVLALEKGRPGERYLLGGINILHEELIARIKKCGGQTMPWLVMPYAMCVAASYASELVNVILKKDKPAIPLIGIELTVHGTQHYSCEKAKRELGYVPGETWGAVDRAYQWYKKKGMLS